MALCKHKDGNLLRELAETVDINIKSDLSTWEIKFWKTSELIVDKNLEAVDKIKKENLLISTECRTVDKEIERRLGFSYRFKEATTIKSNFSVSDLKKKNHERLKKEILTKNIKKASDKTKIFTGRKRTYICPKGYSDAFCYAKDRSIKNKYIR